MAMTSEEPSETFIEETSESTCVIALMVPDKCLKTRALHWKNKVTLKISCLPAFSLDLNIGNNRAIIQGRHRPYSQPSLMNAQIVFPQRPTSSSKDTWIIHQLLGEALYAMFILQIKWRNLLSIQPNLWCFGHSEHSVFHNRLTRGFARLLICTLCSPPCPSMHP